MILRVLLALAVLLLVAGTAVAQPAEMVEEDTIALLDAVVVEPIQAADVPRAERVMAPHTDEGTPPSAPVARVFRPPR